MHKDIQRTFLHEASKTLEILLESDMHVIPLSFDKRPILGSEFPRGAMDAECIQRCIMRIHGLGIQCILSRLISISFNTRKMGESGLKVWNKLAEEMISEPRTIETPTGELLLPDSIFLFRAGAHVIHTYVKENHEAFPPYFQNVTKRLKIAGIIVRRGMAIAPTPTSCNHKKKLNYKFICQPAEGRIQIIDAPVLNALIRDYFALSGNPVDQRLQISDRPIDEGTREFIRCLRRGLWRFGELPSRIEVDINSHNITYGDIYEDYILWCSFFYDPLPLKEFVEDIEALTNIKKREIGEYSPVNPECHLPYENLIARDIRI